jgi:RUN and FYVE domain-containing protein 1
VKTELDQLRKKYNDDQITLEELGIQLSVSKLQISDLKEKAKASGEGNGKTTEWTPDNICNKCNSCNREFR